MEMLKNWIEENIETLYADPRMVKRFLSKPVSKKERDIKIILAQKSVSMRKDLMIQRMLEFCEEILLKRRARVYTKKVTGIREKTSHKIDF